MSSISKVWILLPETLLQFFAYCFLMRAWNAKKGTNSFVPEQVVVYVAQAWESD